MTQKKALDTVITKSRIHLYKPIQIAEILYHIRRYGDINPLELEEYRTKSKNGETIFAKRYSVEFAQAVPGFKTIYSMIMQFLQQY